MQDNELYNAMREGRVPLQIDLQKSGDQWEAKYEGFGISVSVKDDSQTYAQSQVIKEVFDRVRNHQFEIKVG